MRYWDWHFRCDICDHQSRWYPYPWMARVAMRWHFIRRGWRHMMRHSYIEAKGTHLNPHSYAGEWMGKE